jgi:hypothetical protein
VIRPRDAARQPWLAAAASVRPPMPREPREKALAPAELARARADLAAAHGKRRLDLILDARNPQALVRALPADELYLTIRDVGLADAVELVQLASPHQFKVFLDLDAWRGYAFDPSRAMPWLRAARSGAAMEPRPAARWAAKLAAIDPEILFLLLRTSLRIHDLEVDEDPEFESDRFMRTPEGKYDIEFMVDGTEYLAIRGILDDLYAEDPFKATRLLSAIRSEFESELEETALRWRTARLADLGYPSLDEALSWFARPPAPGARMAAPGAPARPPGFFLAQFQRGTLLDRAVARLAPEDREAVELQIVSAANAVLVADAVDPGDPDAVRTSIEAARAYLELGLERLAGADEAAAAAALEQHPVKRVFQEGFVRVLELRWRAERIFRAGGAGRREAPILDAPLGEALTALVTKRPRYFPGLELERTEWATPEAAVFTPRHFLSSADLGRTADALDLVEGLAALARALGMHEVRVEGPLAPRLTALYLTALANERLGRPFAPAPIPSAELTRAVAALGDVDDPRLAAAGAPGALLRALARQRLEELAQLREGHRVRPEHVTALIVR